VTGVHLVTGHALLPALHLIAVGALGTLSCSVMLRLAWQRARRRFPPAWQVLAIAVLIALAGVCRYLAGPLPFSQPGLLWLAASAWTLTFLGVFVQLLRLYPESTKRGKPDRG
ncbi:MAG TPA: NnrS family protein, partial [Marinobacter sp.]|nr:NnrS family protein [Marinobacter sp.]